MKPFCPIILFVFLTVFGVKAGADEVASPVRVDRNEEDRPAGWHLRLGLHASGKDVGLQLGVSRRLGLVSAGIDGWIRPGLYTQNIQITPTRRAQYQELLYGMLPWIQWELTPSRPWSLALVSGLDVSGGDWYGTSRGPDAEVTPSFGVKVLGPSSQLSVRRSWSPGLLGAWRGELVWEL